MFLFSFGFAETMEVYYTTDTPIGGFQFNVDGVTVTGASGGHATANGFMISSSATTVLGFSLTGSIIPAGSGVLVQVEIDGDAGVACLSDIVLSDPYGAPIDNEINDCNTIIISEDDIIDGIDSNIRGKITNSDGEPIIGTQVFIEELGIGAVADTAGNYILLNLPIGSYDITAEMILYRSQIISNVIVDTEKTTELNITLDVEEHLKPSYGSINKFYNTSWAVIIGINEYENISPLRFAVQDAKEIRKLLISEFGFPKENVRILIDNEATLNNIRNDLHEIASMANEEDRILVYFAGHGETRSLKSGVEKGYLIPTDGNLDKIFNTCLPMTEIKDIANETVAKHVLFLMDACFSGLAAVDTRGIDRSTPGYIEKIVRDKARQIITAGGKNEEVIEKDEWGHSAFAKNLIHGLKDAIADQDYDGYITADELGSFLQKRVTIDSENLQTPIKARFGSGEGEFVFLAKKIIESAIIGIVPNEWGEDRTSSIKADLLTVEDIHLLYGENEIVKKLYQKIVELNERLAQGVQFIYGCMDENALNYNSDANLDDESCIVLDSDDVYIRFGDFHNLDSTLDVFMASKRRIYNLEIFTEGFEIIDVLDGNLNTDNINTSFAMEEIFIEFSDSLNGYILPKEETLVFKVKILPIDEEFCFNGLTINDDDTTNVKLGECKAGLMVQEVALTDTTEVEILTGEYAAETGTILQETEEGKYDILLEDSTIVEGVDPSEVFFPDFNIHPGNYFYIKNVDLNKSIIEIGMNSLEEVAGFQFDIDGVSIMSAYGGAATENGFMLSANSTTTIGFSLSGGTISAGRYTLVELEVSPINDAYSICIHGIVVSDPSGNAIDIETGECWVP